MNKQAALLEWNNQCKAQSTVLLYKLKDRDIVPNTGKKTRAVIQTVKKEEKD